MFSRILLISSLSLLPLTSVQALETASVGEKRLHELGARLEASSGTSQWQQLWQNARRAGMFEVVDNSPLHFVVNAVQLAGLARQTLAKADQVTPLPSTRALYRRTFEPMIIGYRDGQALQAVCLEVDWRALPTAMATTPEAYLGLAGLRKVYPCD